MFWVERVGIIIISFTLETDIPVRGISVLIADPFQEPFHHIPYIKPDNQQLYHLPCVNGFMGKDAFIQSGLFLSRKDDPEKVDRLEPLYRKEVGIDNSFHTTKGRNIP